MLEFINSDLKYIAGAEWNKYNGSEEDSHTLRQPITLYCDSFGNPWVFQILQRTRPDGSSLTQSLQTK